ncbi:hypothetical protein HHI36_012822, partial [Cryptolaemus montrouzieri]
LQTCFSGSSGVSLRRELNSIEYSMAKTQFHRRTMVGIRFNENKTKNVSHYNVSISGVA